MRREELRVAEVDALADQELIELAHSVQWIPYERLALRLPDHDRTVSRNAVRRVGRTLPAQPTQPLHAARRGPGECLVSASVARPDDGRPIGGDIVGRAFRESPRQVAEPLQSARGGPEERLSRRASLVVADDPLSHQPRCRMRSSGCNPAGSPDPACRPSHPSETPPRRADRNPPTHDSRAVARNGMRIARILPEQHAQGLHPVQRIPAERLGPRCAEGAPDRDRAIGGETSRNPFTGCPPGRLPSPCMPFAASKRNA